jgi:hypothetical protein
MLGMNPKSWNDQIVNHFSLLAILGLKSPSYVSSHMTQIEKLACKRKKVPCSDMGSSSIMVKRWKPTSWRTCISKNVPVQMYPESNAGLQVLKRLSQMLAFPISLQILLHELCTVLVKPLMCILTMQARTSSFPRLLIL